MSPESFNDKYVENSKIRTDIKLVNICGSIKLQKSYNGHVRYLTDAPNFYNVECANSWIDNHVGRIQNNICDEDIDDINMMYGFDKVHSGNTVTKYSANFVNSSTQLYIQAELRKYSDNSVEMSIRDDLRGFFVYEPDFIHSSEDIVLLLDDILCKTSEKFSSIVFTDSSSRLDIIECASNSRDLSKDLVRVKSSNMWAYKMNIKDRKDKVGDLIIQFKGNNGGAGDIYMYFDVPIKLYRGLVGASSKGHYFWQYIRNKFSYRKLTGDKRGKLPNAIN